MNASEEEFISDDEAEGGAPALNKLREKLQKAIEEKQEYLEGWQRARADFVNYKREEASMHSDKAERIKADFLEQLLPALDTLELSLRHAKGTELSLIAKQFSEALGKMGIEQFGAAGEAFDPYTCEALQEVPTDEEAKDHTIESIQRAGYKIGERIVRPAQVSVYIYKH